MPRKSVKKLAHRSQWVLFITGCLAVTAIAYWQYSSDAPAPVADAPKPLTISAPPASTAYAAPVESSKPGSSKPVAAVAPAKATPITPAAKAPVTPAAKASEPARVTNNDPPPAPKTAPRREIVVAAAVPVATFAIIHDHSRGNFETDHPKATCVGELRIFENELRFEPREGGDRFAASWADVKDVGGNRFFGSGRGGFHVSVNMDGKYKNFNLAPQSKEKAEAKQILDLLNSYTRRTDRTK
ncbi:MAG: hypothetical protein K2Y23_27500 [Cyanobacteria bacterium]|nr:hypothetical protein [Cyanobacteriota bacterium]